VCRVKSHYIVQSPSAVATPAAHATVLAAHRLRCSQVDCRAHDLGRGRCPHGASCFYRHRGEDGSEGAEGTGGIRVTVDEEGLTKGVSGIRLNEFLDGI
jgi:hypothetical protein